MTKEFDVLIFKRGRCSVYERKQSRIKMHFETPQALYDWHGMVNWFTGNF